MNIKLEDKLQEYMKEIGQCDLVIFPKASKGSCCSGKFLDVKVRFAKEEDAKLVDEGYVVVESEVGKIYYHPDKLAFGRKPKLILNRFLKMVIIQAMDIGAVGEGCMRGIPVE